MATYGSSSQAQSGSSGYNLAQPAGTVNGSYLVAVVHGDASGTSALNLTGGSTWNLLDSGTVGLGAYKLFWKLAGSSEPANYTVAFDDTEGYSTAHVIMSNDAGTSAPVFQVTTAAGSSTTAATPGITPPDSTALEVRFALANGTGSARTWTAPGGLTERTDIQAGSNTTATGTSATRTLASASATTSLNFTASGNVTDKIGITVGIPSGVITQDIAPSSIASGEAFGTAQLNLRLTASGIASGEAFGTVGISLTISPSGIASAEAFGTAIVDAGLRPTGIASGEAFGSATVIRQQFIVPTGVGSAEAFGSVSLQLGYPQEIEPDGIASEEAHGDHTLTSLSRLVLVNPSIQETPAAWDDLNVRFGIHRGITIMKDALGAWRQVRYPAQTEIEIAQRVYLGGRRHIISSSEADELIGAGFGAYILLEPDI